MKSDIEIARSTELMKIKQIAQNYGIPVDQVHHYGSYMAKVSETLIDEEKVKQSNLIEGFLCLARAFARPLFRDEGRSRWRRICTGTSNGKNQFALYGRFPCHHFGA